MFFFLCCCCCFLYSFYYLRTFTHNHNKLMKFSALDYNDFIINGGALWTKWKMMVIWGLPLFLIFIYYCCYFAIKYDLICCCRCSRYCHSMCVCVCFWMYHSFTMMMMMRCSIHSVGHKIHKQTNKQTKCENNKWVWCFVLFRSILMDKIQRQVCRARVKFFFCFVSGYGYYWFI